MSVTNKIKIDMVNSGATPCVRAVQNDSLLRVLEVELFADGVEYDLSGKTVSFAFKKPDGTSGWYDTLPDGNSAISVAENLVTISIAPQVLTVKGKVVTAVRVDDGVGRISTFPFIINVAEDPGNNATESENYYSVQNWDEVNAAIDELYALVGGGGGGGAPGTDGTTFFPSVSTSGVISWTNDGGKENPEPVDLRAAVIASLPVYNGEVEPV